jgi:DNA-binding transcriptional regulator LsrR (DeoR family)
MARSAQGSSAAVLVATVARRYYLQGKTKIEIAEEFGMSRFKVARMIESARTSGMVRIQLDYHGEVDLELASELQSAFSLRHSVVIDDGDVDPLELRRHLGRVAGELLTEIVEVTDVLGLAWARSLMDMRHWLVGLPACTVVQLTGALSRPDVDGSSIDLVRDVARIGGGPAFFFHAPMILPDATTTQALRTQPEVARAIERFPSVTKAIVGVGAWQPRYSTVVDALTEQEWREMYAQGVRADLSGVQVDKDGAEVITALTPRTIGITATQLRAIPDVIGIVYDAVKAPAACAGIKGGYLNGLVTHSSLARALLAIR